MRRCDARSNFFQTVLQGIKQCLKRMRFKNQAKKMLGFELIASHMCPEVVLHGLLTINVTVNIPKVGILVYNIRSLNAT